jgi:hypothetical protein
LNHAFNSYTEFPPIIFGWTEPFGIAGHAISITGLGGCLECGMSPKGQFEYAVSRWENGKNLRYSPACGETYQPYGIIDIAPIQSMIARLALDHILHDKKQSIHRAWIGKLNDIEGAGGELREEALDYYGQIVGGYRTIEKQWEINSSCWYKH